VKAKASWWGSRLARQSMRAVVAYLRRARCRTAAAMSLRLARARDAAPCYARVRSLSLSLSLVAASLRPSRDRRVPRCLCLARFLAAPRSHSRARRCVHVRAVLLFEPGRPASRTQPREYHSELRSFVCMRVCFRGPDESRTRNCTYVRLKPCLKFVLYLESREPLNQVAKK